MPNRLLSIRKRKNINENVNPATDTPEYFDFDFRVDRSPTSPLATRKHDGRPRTSGRDGPTTKLVDLPNIRPRSSSGPLVMTKKDIAAIQAEDSWIGLALGSPTNPPPGWKGEPLSIDRTIQRSNTAELRPQSRWRKIGDKLRPKVAASIPNTEYTIHKLSNNHNIDKDRRIQATQNTGNQSDSRKLFVPSVPRQRYVSDTSNVESKTAATEKFPHLNVDIPSVQLDRYSVMFNGISGVGPSALLSRRSKAVADLQTLQSRKSRELPPLPMPRRVTSPTTTKSVYSLFPPQHDIRPNSRDSTLRINIVPTQYCSRPMSSPARLSPYKVDDVLVPVAESVLPSNNNCGPPTQHTADQSLSFEAQPTQTNETPMNLVSTGVNQTKYRTPENSISRVPLPKNAAVPAVWSDLMQYANSQPAHSGASPSSDVLSSPEDDARRHKKDEAPWMSRASIESLASSNSSVEDTIFFGITSFKDSKDDLQSDFIISRPDSAAVQLARAASKKAKEERAEPTTRAEAGPTEPFLADMTGATLVNMPPDLQAAEHRRMNSTDSSVGHPVRYSMFDKTIAEVERLATTSTSVEALPTPAQRLLISHVTPVVKSQPKPPMHFRGLAIGIPSPIMERSEECTPIIVSSQSLSPNACHIANQTSPVPSRKSVPPPPVPEKDTKFIPVSRYAMPQSSTSTNTGTGSPKKSSTSSPLLIRSFTDPSPPYSVPPTTPQPQSPPTNPTAFSARAGAASLPYPASTLQHDLFLSPTSMPYQIPPAFNLNSTSIIAVAVVDPLPNAEVSVARSVSLRRKPSCQVLVSRSGSTSGNSIRSQYRQGHVTKGGERPLPSIPDSSSSPPTPLMTSAPPPPWTNDFPSEVNSHAPLIDPGETLHLSLESRAKSPIMREVGHGHRYGVSVDLVLEDGA